jgi:hypothetical protein
MSISSLWQFKRSKFSPYHFQLHNLSPCLFCSLLLLTSLTIAKAVKAIISSASYRSWFPSISPMKKKMTSCMKENK